MSNRKEKTVSFNSDTLQTRSNSQGYSTSRATMNSNTTLNPWDRGYSSDNLYWGIANSDIDRAKKRMSENQSKFIQERISQVEKHFGDLCTNFGAYSRKTASLRDKGDILGRSILAYAENESLNHTTKAALKDFSENFSGVQDFREIEVKRIESKVLQPLSEYGHQCKIAKGRLKQAFTARDKEMKQKKKLDNVRDKKPSDRHTIAETDLHQASVDASRSSKALEEEMDSFEKKKLQDIKHILLDFVNIELLYHAKALEMYTRCYQSLTTMSEEEDLEEFRNSLRPTSARARLQQMQQSSGSRSSLNSTGMSGQSAGSYGKPRTVQSAGPKAAARTNGRDMNDTLNSTSMYSETQDEDDDDDDEDDDDEDDDEDDDDDEEESEEESEISTQQQKGRKPTSTTYSMFQAKPK